MLPLGDEPNPRGVPWVTYALIAINSAVYLFVSLPLSGLQPSPADPSLNPVLAEYVGVIADQFPQTPPGEILQQISQYDLLVFNYGFRPVDPLPLALLTAMFLHSGFLHLTGNMLFLWIYGDNVEHRLGPMWYLVAYLVTGAAATSFHAVFNSDSLLPMVGASGAISGVLGFYFIWFPHNRVRLWVVLFPFFMKVVRWPARLVLGLYLFMDNLLPFLITRGMEGGGVAYGAHIGGFIGGLGWAWVAGRRELIEQPAEYRPERGQQEASPGEAVAALVANGQFRDAAPAYFGLTAEQTRRLLAPGHSISLGNWLANHGHPEAAVVLYQRHLRDYPLGPLATEAHLGVGLVQLKALGQPTAAYQHLVEVFDLKPDAETESRARQALAEVAARQKFKVPGG